MAAEVIIAQFEADAGKAVADINTLVASLGRVESVSDKTAKEVDKDFEKVEGAAKETTASVKTTTATIQQMGPKSSAAIKQVNGQFAGLKDLALQLGPAIGVAFGIDQVVRFGRASVEAYIDAEKNASLLLNALNGNEAVQRRLLDQASKIQETTIYDDDSVQQAQTFLATQGRTEEQIRKTINAAVELSSVTGDDLQTSVQKLDQTYEGSIGRLGKLDGEFKKLSQTELANGAAIDLVLEKYAGFAEAAGNTTAGKIAKARNQLGEFQEFLGGQLLMSVGDAFTAFNSSNFDGFITNLDEAYSRLNPLGIGLAGIISTVRDVNDAFKAFDEGDYEEALLKMGKAALDLYGSFNPLVGVAKQFGERLGLVSTEISEAEQIQQRFEARQNAFNKALTEGGDSLEIFYRRAAEVLGATREQFDEYVKSERTKLGVDKADNEQTREKITLLQALSKEMQELTSRVQNTIAAGGVVQQGDVDRIIELEKRIKGAAEEYAKLIQRTKDRSGFNATGAVTVDPTQQFDITPAQDYAQQLFDINSEAGDEILKRFIADEERKREEIQKTFEAQVAAASDALSYAEQIFGAIGQIVNASFDSRINKINQERDAQVAAVNSSLLSEEQKSQKIDTINKSAARKEYELQKKQFEINKAISITQTVINTAASIVAQLTNPTPYVGIALAAVAAATGAAQIAVIAAQAPPAAPSFFKGTPYLQRGKNKPGRDTIPIMADEGEAIIPRSNNAEFPGMAQAWISGRGHLLKYIHNKFAAPMIEEGRRLMEQEKQKQLAEHFAMSLSGTGKFSDARLYGVGRQTNEYLSGIYEELKRKPKRRG